MRRTHSYAVDARLLSKAVDYALKLHRSFKKPMPIALLEASERYGFSMHEISKEMIERRKRKYGTK